MPPAQPVCLKEAKAKSRSRRCQARNLHDQISRLTISARAIRHRKFDFLKGNACESADGRSSSKRYSDAGGLSFVRACMLAWRRL